MRTILIILVALLFGYISYAQTLPPQPPVFTFHSKSSFIIEEIDGLSVYKWKHNRQKVTADIHIGSEIQDVSHPMIDNRPIKGRLINGLQQGKWIYGSDGGFVNEVNYDRGLIVGKYKVYDGIDSVIGIYDERGDRLANKWVVIRDTVYYETTFVNGNGLWKDYYGNGELKEEGMLKGGKKDGEWCYYTHKGHFLFRKRKYKDGVLISQEDYEIPAEFIELWY